MRRTKLAMVSAAVLTATIAAGPGVSAQDAATAEPGQDVNIMLLPKFLGILPFDQANQGAQEAHAELGGMDGNYTYTGPTAENSVAGQIETLTNAPTQGFDVVLLSNNAGDQIVPAAQAAQEAGTKVVTWDSSIPSAEGESLFVAQVDFDDIGQVMADMTRSILGEDGGQVAILSASPDASNQNAWNAAYLAVLEGDDYANIEMVELVFGNDVSEDSFSEALGLVDKWPELGLIMAPTSVGIVAAAQAIQTEGLCDDIKISGLGVPAEMVEFTLNGCAPEFTLWDFVDLGYLSYYVGYLIATGAIEGVEGDVFEVGRPIGGQTTFEVTTDPTRSDVDGALRVLMGPFTVYNADNVEAAAS
jgi:rhamnose transport system substrate-binding protein